MSTAPKNLHNFDLPDLKWAHTNPSSHRRKLSGPSPQPDSDDPNQEPTQQQQQQPPANASDVEADASAVMPSNLQPQTPPNETHEAVNLDGGPHRNERREKRKPKLSISLTKEEIEEDLYSMTGSKTTRRPKRRTKAVQKALDNVFPGLSLDGTSADSYRVQHLP